MLATWIEKSNHVTPWGRSAVVTNEWSDAYASKYRCSAGASGRAPAARIQTASWGSFFSG